jgi:succinate dehydrogenase / fumarate reductase iron-sulfur subunit
MDTATDACRMRVFRYKRGDERGEHFDEFDVPVEPDTTVLDGLLWIRQHRDPSLALRASCLHSSCGTCGVLVNGREELGCVKKLRDAGPRVTVEPLANLPILADLVVDSAEFYARFPGDHPIIRASELMPESATPDELAAHLRLEDCLECSLCLSACPVAAASDSYVGPAALVAAQRLLEEPRGTSPDAVREWANQPGGAWSCHVGYECTEVCPAGFDPAARIMALRRELMRR